MKKKLLIGILLIIIFAFIIVKVIFQYDNLVNLPEDNKKKLMSALKIEDAPSFKPISKKKLLIPMSGPFAVYEIKFEISIKDYEKNNLHYYDGEPAALDEYYKIKKNENTYLCFIHTSTQTEHTKKLYRELLDALK